MIGHPLLTSLPWQAALQRQVEGDADALPDLLDAFFSAQWRGLRAHLNTQIPGAGAALDAAFARSSAAPMLRRDFSRTLPTELVLEILERLDWVDLARLGRVNHKLHAFTAPLLEYAPTGALSWPHMPVRASTMGLADNLEHARGIVRRNGSCIIPCPTNAALRVQLHEAGIEVFAARAGALHGTAYRAVPQTSNPHPAWSPDGRLVSSVAAGVNGHPAMLQVFAVDAKTGRLSEPVAKVALTGITNDTVHVAFASLLPGETLPWVAVGTPGDVRIVDLAQGRVLSTLPRGATNAHNWTKAIRWMPNAHTLALLGAGRLGLWDFSDPATPTRLPVPTFSEQAVCHVEFHPTRAEYVVSTTVQGWSPSGSLYLVPVGSEQALGDCNPSAFFDNHTSPLTNFVPVWEPSGSDLMMVARDAQLALVKWERNRVGQATLTRVRHLPKEGNVNARELLWLDPHVFDMVNNNSWTSGRLHVAGKKPRTYTATKSSIPGSPRRSAR